MNRRCVVISVLLLSAAFAGSALAQQPEKSLKDQLVGTWVNTSSNIMGEGAKGVFILDANGRYAFILMSAERPKFAAGNRAQGSAEENKAAMQKSIGYYGTWSIDEAAKTLITKVEGSTYPNLEGNEQKRIITKLTADEFHFVNPSTTVGMRGEATWKKSAEAFTLAAKSGPGLKDQLEGTWTNAQSGVMGPGAKGLLMFDGKDRFAFVLMSAQRPNFASNNRSQGTDEENKAAVAGSIAYFGSYAVDDASKTLITRIEGSTYPNMEGTEQKRTITSLTAEELQYVNPSTSIGTRGEAVWRRVKPTQEEAAR
jgi:Lipocalin-like domain